MSTNSPKPNPRPAAPAPAQRTIAPTPAVDPPAATIVVPAGIPADAQPDVHGLRAAWVNAQALQITSHELYEATAEDVKTVRAARLRLEERLERIVKPARDAANAARAEFKPVIEGAEKIEKLLKSKLAAYAQRLEDERRAAEQKAREEQERARRQAEREARERQEAEAARARELEAAAAKAAAPEEAAQLLEQANDAHERAETAVQDAHFASTMIAAPVVADAALERPAVAGIAMRKTWKFEVTDKLALIRAAAADETGQLAALLVPDNVAIGQLVRALKDRCNVPGVRAWAETSVAAGGAK